MITIKDGASRAVCVRMAVQRTVVTTMSRQKQEVVFAVVLVAITLALGWVLWPFFGALLWALLLAIIFTPFYERLLTQMRHRRNLAASTTVFVIALLVVFPLTVVGTGLVQEVASLIDKFQSGQIDAQRWLTELRGYLPAWATNLLDRFEATPIADMVERFFSTLLQGGQFLARQILSIGQATLGFLLSLFVMLYVLFYFVRDGATLLGYLERATPLPPEQQHVLFNKFTATVRGTVKGNLVLAIVQGALGGLIFWVLNLGTPILWGAVMAVLSLLPLVGTGMVWVPAAIYLMLTGAIGEGVVLLAYGILVISSMEYILRPWLVGSDLDMPAYLVLLSTLGGVATFGVNGFVIGPLVAALFLAVWHMHLQTRAAEIDGE